MFYAVMFHLATQEALRDIENIPPEICAKEYAGALKKWGEWITTSPSGRHFGFT